MAASRGPTYSELHIITAQPTRREYVLPAQRLETFKGWPSNHHLKPEDLVAAGFYYAGYGDSVRCFYCNTGLNRWEIHDDVWVEHARWSPKCAHICMHKGFEFVKKVGKLHIKTDQITYSMVIKSMEDEASAFTPDTKASLLKKDPAVRAVLELRHPEKDVLEIAESLHDARSSFLSADDILKHLLANKGEMQVPANISASNSVETAKVEEAISGLKSSNNRLRQRTVCKICMEDTVAVIFLPCGHLVSCLNCSMAMRECPVCRRRIVGVVRGYMS